MLAKNKNKIDDIWQRREKQVQKGIQLDAQNGSEEMDLRH